tara:strand:+ start:193 stop:423 length:231 start_codon:yes stop_codon:yes gene_type:complete
MFKPEDFQLSLEALLKLRVVNDDIDKCTDVEVLREQLKNSVRLLMNYQQIIQSVLKEQITKDLTDFGVILKDLEDS